MRSIASSPPHFFREPVVDPRSATVSRVVVIRKVQRTRVQHHDASSTMSTAVLERIPSGQRSDIRIRRRQAVSAYLLKVLLAGFAHVLIGTETGAQHLHQHPYRLRHRSAAK